MKLCAVICAAGSGERAGFGKNKLLAPLNGAPALWWTLRKFASKKIKPQKEVCCPRLYEDGFDSVIVTCSPRDEEEIKALCAPFGFTVVLGGDTRTTSVYNALKVADCDIVIIHDGARPYISENAILDCIETVKEKGSAICATPAVDTTAIVSDGKISAVPARESVYSVQTPQGFFIKDILPAYEKAIKDSKSYTDDGSVYAEYVAAPYIYLGNAENKKLTYAADFENAFFKTVNAVGKRVGFGVDTHIFGGERDFIALCGVKIPCGYGLIAHSDGDAALHAVMDAILSAAGLKDIGFYFPDSDEKFKGTDSLKLLETVMNEVKKNGLKVTGISVAIQAEKPRLARYIDEMKLSLSRACEVGAENIGITAGTCEGTGFVGTLTGITVYAIALLG